MPKICFMLDIPDTKLRDFLYGYKNFMQDTVYPKNIGVEEIEYTVQIPHDKEGQLVVETNKQLNQASTSMIVYLTNGYIAGYKNSPYQKEDEG